MVSNEGVFFKIVGMAAVGGVLAFGSSACGTYQDLAPEAKSVTATTIRPSGNCKSLGSLTGKGGGASGGYVSNEDLIEYAVNDLRNQAGARGATHVVYTAPSMGGHSGTTTSAMVVGEALRCKPGEAPTASEEPVVEPANAGCEHDAQCKGDRVCVDRECVDPAPKPQAASAAGTATATPVPAAPEPGAAPRP